MGGVTLRDVELRHAGAPLLGPVSLDVAEGEFLVLLGPSGCGKTSLLHAIAGLLPVHAGRIEIGGVDVTDADPKDRGIAMVFQSYALYPTMTVEKNLSFGLRVAGVARDEVDRRVARAAGLLQLGDLLQRKPGQLSGGQRQRVAIGRALVREAPVWLFDEPLSNLDARLRAELRHELKQLHRALGATMVYVTHDQVEAMSLGSRIVVMNADGIQQIDTPATVYARPANRFVAGFLGSPGMNFVDAVLEAGPHGPRVAWQGVRVELPDEGLTMLPAGLPVVMGVRPEHLALTAADAPGAVPAVVTAVEPLGPNQVVWVAVAGTAATPGAPAAGGVVLAIDASVQLGVVAGQRCGVTVSPAGVSLFSRDSGLRL